MTFHRRPSTKWLGSQLRQVTSELRQPMEHEENLDLKIGPSSSGREKSASPRHDVSKHRGSLRVHTQPSCWDRCPASVLSEGPFTMRFDGNAQRSLKGMTHTKHGSQNGNEEAQG